MDVPLAGDRVAVPYGMNGHRTLFLAIASYNNVCADDGTPIEARAGDVVYLPSFPGAYWGP